MSFYEDVASKDGAGSLGENIFVSNCGEMMVVAKNAQESKTEWTACVIKMS